MPRAFTASERSRLRLRLKEGAARLAALRGVRRTTIAGLAREAGISKGAFYAFFESKEALFLELLQETEHVLRAEVTELAAQPGAPVDVLGAVLEHLRQAVADHPLLGVLTDPEEAAALFRGLPGGALEAAEASDDEWFTTLFRGLAERGVVSEDHVAELVEVPRVLFALAAGRRWLAGRFETTSRALVASLAIRYGRGA